MWGGPHRVINQKIKGKNADFCAFFQIFIPLFNKDKDKDKDQNNDHTIFLIKIDQKNKDKDKREIKIKIENSTFFYFRKNNFYICQVFLMIFFTFV